MDTLLERKMSFALGARSALCILTHCINFARKCREGMLQRTTSRKQRQAERVENRQLRLEKLLSRSPIKHSPAGDMHDRPVAAPDLINCSWGLMDEFLQQNDVKKKNGKQEEQRNETEMERDKRRVFHHLCCLYQHKVQLRGFEGKTLRNIEGGESYVLEGRRHRD